MRQRPGDTQPFLCGSSEVVDGYYDLEEIERNVGMGCLTRHPKEVQIWYRALTLYCQAMTRKWDHTESGEPNEVIKSRSLQVHLLGLNLGLAKSCLDTMLAGYYSVAFATIRHMLETCMHNIYFLLYPNEASDHWRTAETIRSQVRKKTKKTNPRIHRIVEQLYSHWSIVSIGAHPSVEGLRASESDYEGIRVFGANYVEEMFYFGMEQGLFAVGNLLNWFRVVGVPSDDWIPALDTWMQDVNQWRTDTIAPKVNDKGEWTAPV